MTSRRVITPDRTRRAALLLEVMLALALLVTSSSLVVGVVRDSANRLDRAMDMGAASDLGFSALTQIEAGLATPETLSGPAPAWSLADEFDAASGPTLSSDDIAIEPAIGVTSEWSHEIDTQSTGFDGLTLVSVSTAREGAARNAVTVHQLVRLEAPESDEIGDEDELDALIREANESGTAPDVEAAP